MCSGKNLLNSPCHFQKYKSVFLQTLHQYSVPSNITHLYFLNSNIIYFGQKQPIKVQIFEIFKCSGQNPSNSSSLSSSIFGSFFIAMTHTFLLNFFKLIHFQLRKKDAIKVPFVRLSNALMKICQIPHVVLRSIYNSVFLQTLYVLSVIKHNSSVLSKLKYYILWSKASHQSANS